MTARINMIGRTFNKWTVIARSSERKYGGLAYLCRCGCGVEKVISGAELRRNKSRSCKNCSNVKHGATSFGTEWPEYRIWKSMLGRCTNPSDKSYPRYGGRGISVCDRWRDFSLFIADMGRRPSPSLSIERVDNNGNYEPANCCWATKKQQNRNQRKTIRITHNGVTQSLADWAEQLGLKYTCLHQRLFKLKWPPEIALTSGAHPLFERKVGVA